MEMQSADIKELAQALILVQKDLKPAAKDTENPFFGSTYADLTSVWEAIRPLLAANGLSVVQGVTPAEDPARPNIFWTTLMHSSGQWIRSACPLILGKTDPQSVGSALTYYRRYLLAAMLGVTQADDDGNAATDKAEREQRREQEKKPASQPAAAPSTSETPPFAPGEKDGEWKPVFKLTPEEKLASEKQNWKREERASKKDPSKKYVWFYVPPDFDPGQFPVPPPVDQPPPPAKGEKAPEPAAGAPSGAVALASALQTAETREALGKAWAEVLKVQKELDAKTLTGLGKIKQQKEASLPS